MARLFGVDIPDNKRIEISLTYVYGIGLTQSRKILTDCGISPDLRARELTDDDLLKIRNAVDKYKLPVEGELRRMKAQNIRRLQEIKSYRGQRHLHGLPVRGQRTSTNARTRKGKKKTVGNVHVKASAKK